MTDDRPTRRTRRGSTPSSRAHRGRVARRRAWGSGSGIGRVVTISEARWRTGVSGDDDHVVGYLKARSTAAIVTGARSPRIDLGCLTGESVPSEETASLLGEPALLERGTLS